jgi:hypothetical protein
LKVVGKISQINDGIFSLETEIFIINFFSKNDPLPTGNNQDYFWKIFSSGQDSECVPIPAK